uniref:Uncharacterized protein n=1 Tax=Pipistrellus kuhlii TaxID=59472 RepID=A0A7J7VMG7_PIPKU|nr:hypothetical protein mPipKuh1_008365 [Pipistrellus kuhlii]
MLHTCYIHVTSCYTHDIPVLNTAPCAGHRAGKTSDALGHSGQISVSKVCLDSLVSNVIFFKRQGPNVRAKEKQWLFLRLPSRGRRWLRGRRARRPHCLQSAERCRRLLRAWVTWPPRGGGSMGLAGLGLGVWSAATSEG